MSPRAAGTGSHYAFVLRNNSTGRYDHTRTISLPSVTSIIKQTLAAPALIPWTYRETRDAIVGLANYLIDNGASDNENELSGWDMLTDPDILEELLKDNKLRPEDQMEAGAEIGSEHHEFLEQLGRAFLEADEDAARSMAERAKASAQGHKLAIADWWLYADPYVKASESMVFSLRHGFAGTLDLVWRDEKTDRLVITDLKNRKEKRFAYESDHIQTGAYKIAYEEMFGEVVDTRTVLVARADGTWIEEESTIPESAFLHLFEVWKAIKGVKI